MKQGKFSEAQILNILGSQGKDKSVENLCREHGISPATFYNRTDDPVEKQIRWYGFGGVETNERVRIRECSAEKVVGR